MLYINCVCTYDRKPFRQKTVKWAPERSKRIGVFQRFSYQYNSYWSATGAVTGYPTWNISCRDRLNRQFFAEYFVFVQLPPNIDNQLMVLIFYLYFNTVIISESKFYHCFSHRRIVFDCFTIIPLQDRYSIPIRLA